MRESLLLLTALMVGAQVGPDQVPGSNVPAQASIPTKYWTKNVGGRDGAGLCVFTSIQHSAVRQNEAVLRDFQQWMRSKPGGGYPKKVDAMIAAKCLQEGRPTPSYLQVRNNDLEILRAACASGRMPGITYCYSPSGRYGGRRISHMVSLIHADKNWFGILDNNYVSPGQIEWLSEKEFYGTYTGQDGGWSVILLNEGPPPRPKN